MHAQSPTEHSSPLNHAHDTAQHADNTDAPNNSTFGARIHALDVIRGFALMGILIMNIQSFAMPSAAYFNPTAWGSFTGADKLIWLISHVLADQKFMTLFSALFGAGILLYFQGMAQKRLPLATQQKRHQKRMLWLMAFGLIHAYGLWYGDILFTYAVCGLLMAPLRHAQPTKLLGIGLLFLTIPSALTWLFQLNMASVTAEGLVVYTEFWQPSVMAMKAEIANYQNGVVSGVVERADDALMMQTQVLLLASMWRVSGLMLLGMALYKSGFFTQQWSWQRYVVVALGALTLGFYIVLHGVQFNLHHDFDVMHSLFAGGQYNYWGSILVSFGYACVLMLVLRAGLLKHLTSAFALLGRTAFSNYILQTLLASSVCYWLGLIGHLSRAEQILLVLSIWAAQFMLTAIWLSYFKQGPLEWLWRTLTLQGERLVSNQTKT